MIFNNIFCACNRPETLRYRAILNHMNVVDSVIPGSRGSIFTSKVQFVREAVPIVHISEMNGARTVCNAIQATASTVIDYKSCPFYKLFQDTFKIICNNVWPAYYTDNAGNSVIVK